MSAVSKVDPQMEEKNKVDPQMEEENKVASQTEEESMDDPRMEEDGEEGAEKVEGKKYGTCVGPNAEFVILRSSDGIEFIIQRVFVLQSTTMKAMLSGPGQFAENETNEIHFKEIPSHILDLVCKYLMYKVRYKNSTEEIPDFPIPTRMALELLMAANFLDC